MVAAQFDLAFKREVRIIRCQIIVIARIGGKAADLKRHGLICCARDVAFFQKNDIAIMRLHLTKVFARQVIGAFGQFGRADNQGPFALPESTDPDFRCGVGGMANDGRAVDFGFECFVIVGLLKVSHRISPHIGVPVFRTFVLYR